MKNLVALLGSIVLVLALVLSACAQTAAPTTPTTPATPTTPTTPAAPQVVEKVVEPVYKVLNPAGSRIPVECSPLAPRLDTLAGKKILYYQSEANPVIMPPLLVRLKKEYPTTTFDVLYTEAYGLSTPTEEQTKTYQAVIRGISW